MAVENRGSLDFRLFGKGLVAQESTVVWQIQNQGSVAGQILQEIMRHGTGSGLSVLVCEAFFLKTFYQPPSTLNVHQAL